MNYIKFSKFEDLDDFRDSLLRGREIVFKYNGKEYTTLTFDFDKLTGADSIAIMNEIAMRRGRVVVEPNYDSDYRSAMAARACTEPIGVDIFDGMSLPDFNRIIGKARSFMTSLF